MPLWFELSFCSSVYEIEVALSTAKESVSNEINVALSSSE